MNTEQNLVTVVIPCHNYGQYLGEAIESALNQTYQPVEVVVVDDGSMDESVEVASRYPVTLLAQQNSGVCVAVNRGVSASSGAYVLRLDADDRLAPTYVDETLAELLRDPDTHFVYTAVEYFGGRTGTYPIEEFDPESLAERNYIHCSALMRRASWEQVGGYNLNMTTSRYEDWDLWLAFAERGMRGAMVAKRLLHYRQHQGASRVSFSLSSLSGVRREIALASILQDNHPLLFAPDALIRRLGRLPGRLLRGNVSLRFTLLLTAFYGVMLLRSGRRRLPVAQ